MMAWTRDQRSRVTQILNQNPPASGRCAQAAQWVLPVAREMDDSANALLIEPEEGAIYVQPKGLSVRWFHHVTVSVTSYCVDALTGPGGHQQRTYLESFFNEPAHHVMSPITPDELEGL